MNSIFCLNRLMLGISTGLFETYSLVPCIYSLFGCTIFQLGFYIQFRPMKYKYASIIEIGNLVVIYFTTYSHLIFSNWISDIELNYKLGFTFTNFLVYFYGVHGIIIFWDLYIKLRKVHRKRQYEKKLLILRDI